MSTAARTRSGLDEPVREALERGLERLVAEQHPDGYWWGELESNAAITAEHLFLLEAFGRATDADRRAIATELLETQGDDGGWPVWYSGPSDLSISAEAYYALRLAGVPAADGAMRRARTLVRELGGVNRARFFTRLWFAVLGQYPWTALPVLPPEMIYLPPRAPLSPYRFACWARGTFVALMVVLSRHPVYPQAVGAGELFLEPAGAGAAPEARRPGRWTPWLRRATVLAGAYNRRPLRAVRRRAEERIARWIIDRQEGDGSWGGIQPPWVYSLIALHSLGYDLEHPVMARGLRGFEEDFRLELDGGRRLRIQACLSPVWDTALASVALGEAGLRRGDPPLDRACDWMLGKEVRRYGDWYAIPRRGRPGGWSFEFANEWYPDTDDTAEVLIALRRAGYGPDHPAVRRAVDWLLAMQSASGGWGAFDVDNEAAVMTQLPVCDFGEVIDPPTEDVTAHVVEALVACGLGPEHPAVRRGVAFLLERQFPQGSWWGRWGVNHLYGTGAVLPALAAAGVDMRAPAARRAVRFLVEHQNEDGGWGESPASYGDPSWIARGASTPSQTAWALLGLLAAAPRHPAVDRGLWHLAESQRPDGSWDEPHFTGTGFPGDFLINYHLYRQYFPVTALARSLSRA